MITQIYTIYDSKAEIYNKPFYVINEAIALRTVKDMQFQDNEFTRNPQDFSLWHLGSYDDNHAIFELLSTPKVVAPVHEIFRLAEAGENNDE